MFRKKRKTRVGLTFPASTSEIRVDCIEDLCRYYHRIGIDRIRFINNGGMESIRKLEFVEVVDDLRKRSQLKVVNTSIPHMDDCDWIIVFDSDEWLWGKTEMGIHEFLENAPKNCGAIALNWVMFGNTKQTRNGPCPEECTRRVPFGQLSESSFFTEKHVKCIIRRIALESVSHVHFPKLKPGYVIMDENYKDTTVPYKEFSDKKFVIAHMYGRSREEARQKDLSERFDVDMIVKRINNGICVESKFLPLCTVEDFGFRDKWREVMKEKFPFEWLENRLRRAIVRIKVLLNRK